MRRRRGYDLATFARRGAAAVTGLEISESAVQAATQHLAAQGYGPGQASAHASVVLANFFEYSDPAGPFDLGFDYT